MKDNMFFKENELTPDKFEEWYQNTILLSVALIGILLLLMAGFGIDNKIMRFVLIGNVFYSLLSWVPLYRLYRIFYEIGGE